MVAQMSSCYLNGLVTAIVEVDCYKKYNDSGKVEVFQKPDPELEDRDYYSEFLKPAIS